MCPVSANTIISLTSSIITRQCDYFPNKNYCCKKINKNPSLLDKIPSVLVLSRIVLQDLNWGHLTHKSSDASTGSIIRWPANPISLVPNVLYVTTDISGNYLVCSAWRHTHTHTKKKLLRCKQSIQGFYFSGKQEEGWAFNWLPKSNLQAAYTLRSQRWRFMFHKWLCLLKCV